MLAGRMKLKTFLALFGLGGTTVVGGGLYATGAFDERPPEPVAAVSREPSKAPIQKLPEREPVEEFVPEPYDGPEAEAPEPVQAASSSDRPWDAALLERSGKDLGNSKVKDAIKGKPWKVNLYQDDGSPTMNRAKVDIDRDDKWDEKWTFADDGISRQVAPADDENYTQTFAWDGSGWQAQ